MTDVDEKVLKQIEKKNTVYSDAMKTIITEKNKVIPAILEKDFVDKYLPLFTSKVEVDISRWITEVAGTAHTPVMIIDNQGNGLFEVPPLMRDIEVNEDKNISNSFYEIVMNAQNKSKLSPMQGEAYLRKSLNAKVKNTPPDITYAKKWNEIFKRYDLELIPIPSEYQGEVVEDNVDEDIKDVQGYEEL